MLPARLRRSLRTLEEGVLLRLLGWATTRAVADRQSTEIQRVDPWHVPDPAIKGVVTPQGSSQAPYRWDYPFTYAMQYNPKRRPGSPVTLDTLRTVAGSCDIVRMCINQLKREVWTTPIAFAPRDPDMPAARAKDAMRAAEAFFAECGGLGGRGRRRTHFEGEMIEDLCVVGATAVYCEYSRGGRLLTAECIDAATIRPVVDAFGWAAEQPYEQWIMGTKVTGFDERELIYDGIWSASYNPYFSSPLEWLLSAVTSMLKADEWNREYLISGNTPADLISLPESWGTEQVKSFAAWWDLLLSGNTPERVKTKFVPSGSTRLGNRMTTDRQFAAFELWLLRRICGIYGVQPASIGFVGEQYKVSQDGSMDATSRFGAGTVVEFRKTVYDRILDKIDLGELETVVRPEEPNEEPGEKSKRVLAMTGKPIYTVNEGRAEFGLEPVPDGDELIAPEPVCDPNSDGAPKKGGVKPDDDTERVERAGIVIDWKPTAERRKKAEAAFQKAIDIFNSKAERIVQALATDYFLDGDAALDAFTKDYTDAVLRAHAQAAKAGGMLTKLSRSAAVDIGKEEGADQVSFIDKLLGKIRAMLPEQDILDVTSRIIDVNVPLYAHALTATANRASMAAVPLETSIKWRLEPKAEHCDDCPALEAMGPYTAETLPCLPADGFTQCGPNCRCGLQLEDGTYVSIHDWTEFDPTGDLGDQERAEALRKWERKCMNRLKEGKPAACDFQSEAIDSETLMRVARLVQLIRTPEDVRRTFQGLE